MELKTILLLSCITFSSILAEENKPPFLSDFHDPRGIVSFHEWIVDGKEKQKYSSVSNSLLIISWMPVPDRSKNGYQISGIDGYHSKETVVKFLQAFYSQGAPKGVHGMPVNILIAGNNWGSGKELKSPLEITRKNSISVFHAGGWGFQKAHLAPEPKGRLKLIKKAFGKVNPEAPVKKSPKEKE